MPTVPTGTLLGVGERGVNKTDFRELALQLGERAHKHTQIKYFQTGINAENRFE